MIEEKIIEKIKTNADFYTMLPDIYKTYKVSLEYIKSNQSKLYFVPKEHQDEDLCKSSVEHNFRSLEFVPEHLRSTDVCLRAVRQSKLSLVFVPEHVIATHPFFFTATGEHTYPNSQNLDEYLKIWVNEKEIPESDISEFLKKSPKRLKRTKIWKKWALIYL